MMSTIWEYIKYPFVTVHEYLRTCMPGWKTKLVAAVGAIGSAAALLQEYITGLPLDKLLGVTEALIVSTILFSLAFWFRWISK